MLHPFILMLSFWYHLSLCLSVCLSFCLFVRLGTDCHQSCPDLTYSVNDSMVCAPCEDKQCVICDQSQCFWCKEGFYVYGTIWNSLQNNYELSHSWISAPGARTNASISFSNVDRGHCTLTSWHFTWNISFSVTVMFSDWFTIPLKETCEETGRCKLILICT